MLMAVSFALNSRQLGEQCMVMAFSWCTKFGHRLSSHI
uniref:Uncharacterized protein n=1 Tax=Anguilla anguilla TaxID=7936 RepID=A0A0E9UN36_ANGAN